MWGNEVIVMRKGLEGKVDLSKPETLKGLTVATISKGSMRHAHRPALAGDMGLNPDTDVKFREVAAGAAQKERPDFW